MARVAASVRTAAAVLDDAHEPRDNLLARRPRRDVGVDAGGDQLLHRCWALRRHPHVPQLAPHRVPPVAKCIKGLRHARRRSDGGGRTMMLAGQWMWLCETVYNLTEMLICTLGRGWGGAHRVQISHRTTP